MKIDFHKKFSVHESNVCLPNIVASNNNDEFVASVSFRLAIYLPFVTVVNAQENKRLITIICSMVSVLAFRGPLVYECLIGCGYKKLHCVIHYRRYHR